MDKKHYDVTQFERPSVTADVIVFTIKGSDLKVLLVKRKEWPFKGFWALPGGFVDVKDSLEATAKKKLFEETGIRDVHLEQLYTFGELKRDPRTRVITVAYFALVDSHTVSIEAKERVTDVDWFSLKELPKLAFDHNKILDYSAKRLKWKMEYTTIAYSILAERFTLTELQKVYEVVFDRKFDKRNFRKKILSLNILKDTNAVRDDVGYRPAKLYSFVRKSAEIIEIL